MFEELKSDTPNIKKEENKTKVLCTKFKILKILIKKAAVSALIYGIKLSFEIVLIILIIKHFKF